MESEVQGPNVRWNTNRPERGNDSIRARVTLNMEKSGLEMHACSLNAQLDAIEKKQDEKKT
jgi:hypothetical protein